jgi:spore maturation protein CgeB
MSGAFYLVEYFDELSEFFEPGKEILCFSDPEDLVGKVRYYVSHNDAGSEFVKLIFVVPVSSIHGTSALKCF